MCLRIVLDAVPAMAATRNLLAAAATCGVALYGGVPAQALTTPAQPITNLPQAITTGGSTNLSFAGFNQANFPTIWSSAPPQTTPILSDVRLYIKGVLTGSFSITNTNPNASVTVNSPALTFDLRSNNMVNNNTTTNQTGTVAAAVQKSFITTPPDPPGPPGNPPTSSTNPTSLRYCPGNNWVAGGYEDGDQSWTCLTTASGSFNINPSSATTTTNWSLIGGGNTYSAADSFWSGSSVSVASTLNLNFSGIVPTTSSGTFTLSALPADTNVVYTYNYVAASTPSPLPLLGAGFAFGASRRLRRRVQFAKSEAN